MTGSADEQSSPASTFELLTPADLENLTDLEYLIDGILPAPAFAVLYGPPGAGKSFIALSMGLQVATGQEWLGRTTRAGKVLYVAAEGALGMKMRLQAYREKFTVSHDSIRFIGVPFAIRDLETLDALIVALRDAEFNPDLIIIDTLARVAVGADENSAKDMGQVVEGFESLKRKLGATILVIHHTRKDGNTFRGSSALEGAVDVMIACEPKGEQAADGVILSCAKMKDAEPFSEIGIALEKVALSDGKSSLVVTGPADTTKAQDNHEKHILEIIVNELGNRGVTHKEIKTAFVDSGSGGESTFDRTWRKLKDSQELFSETDYSNRKIFTVRNPEKYKPIDKEQLREVGELFDSIRTDEVA